MDEDIFISTHFQNLISEYQDVNLMEAKKVIHEIPTKQRSIDQKVFRKRVEKILNTTKTIRNSLFDGRSLIVSRKINRRLAAGADEIIDDDGKDNSQFDLKELERIRKESMNREIERAKQILARKHSENEQEQKRIDYDLKFGLAQSKAMEMCIIRDQLMKRCALVHWNERIRRLDQIVDPIVARNYFKLKSQCFSFWKRSIKFYRREHLLLTETLRREKQLHEKAVVLHAKNLLTVRLRTWKIRYTKKRLKQIELEKSKQRKHKISQLLDDLRAQMNNEEKHLSEAKDVHVIKMDKKFIESMEKRQQEREERKKRLEERRKVREQQIKERRERELEIQKEREEKERRKMVEEKKRIQEQIRADEEKKEADRQRMRKNLQVANKWNNDKLKKKFMIKLKKSFDCKGENNSMMDRRYGNSLLQASLITWKRQREQREIKREIEADNKYHKNIMISMWNRVKVKAKKSLDSLKYSTKRQEEFRAKRKLHQWKRATERRKQKRIEWETEMLLISRDSIDKLLKKMILSEWIAKLYKRREDRWRELRREALRQRARELLTMSKLQEELDNRKQE